MTYILGDLYINLPSNQASIVLADSESEVSENYLVLQEDGEEIDSAQTLAELACWLSKNNLKGKRKHYMNLPDL